MAFPTKREKAYKQRLEQAEAVLNKLRMWLVMLEVRKAPDVVGESLVRDALHEYDVAGVK